MDNEAEAEPNVRQAVPFFAVADMESSLHYYVDGLGFEMTHRWIDDGKLRWCWLQLGGAALMLQEFRKEGHNSWTPEAKVGVGVSIYFMCRDALAISSRPQGTRNSGRQTVRRQRDVGHHPVRPGRLQASLREPYRRAGGYAVLGAR